jgi:hypothetical protein
MQLLSVLEIYFSFFRRKRSLTASYGRSCCFDSLGLYPETAAPGSRKRLSASRSCFVIIWDVLSHHRGRYNRERQNHRFLGSCLLFLFV